MNTHADKTQENKSKSVPNKVSLKQGGVESTFQFVDNRPEAVVQRKLQEMTNNSPQMMPLKALQDMANNRQQAKKTAQLQAMAGNHSVQKKENYTGLPDNLKSGIERLSGYSMDDVKVHRNSDKPAQLQAHAFAQGTDIHLGPGQEKHLPHEAWHVVQQKQVRVKPTLQMKGKVNVNDDLTLEKEADLMGEKAMQLKAGAYDSKFNPNTSGIQVAPRPILDTSTRPELLVAQRVQIPIDNLLKIRLDDLEWFKAWIADNEDKKFLESDNLTYSQRKEVLATLKKRFYKNKPWYNQLVEECENPELHPSLDDEDETIVLPQRADQQTILLGSLPMEVKMTDVTQGDGGICYFEVGLMGGALNDPGIVQKLITRNGKSCSVQFPLDNDPFVVSIEELGKASGRGEQWTQILEVAFMKFSNRYPDFKKGKLLDGAGLKRSDPESTGLSVKNIEGGATHRIYKLLLGEKVRASRAPIHQWSKNKNRHLSSNLETIMTLIELRNSKENVEAPGILLSASTLTLSDTVKKVTQTWCHDEFHDNFKIFNFAGFCELVTKCHPKCQDIVTSVEVALVNAKVLELSEVIELIEQSSALISNVDFRNSCTQINRPEICEDIAVIANARSDSGGEARFVYAHHVYAIIDCNLAGIDTELSKLLEVGKNILNTDEITSDEERDKLIESLMHLDLDKSTVTLRNPHGGDSGPNLNDKAIEGAEFNLSLTQFFRHFKDLSIGNLLE